MNKQIVGYFICIILLLSSTFHLVAQEAHILGNSPDYADRELIFYSFDEYITYPIDTLAIVSVAPDGRFEAKLPIQSTRQVYVNLDFFVGIFWAEPTEKYNLVLPELRLKTQAERLNPFFEEQHIYLGLSSNKPDEINARIRELNYLIDSFMIIHEREILNRSLREKELGVFIDSLYRIFPQTDTFWEKQLLYQLAPIKQFISRKPSDWLVRDYFAQASVYPEHPAYASFFKQELVGINALVKKEQPEISIELEKGNWKHALSNLKKIDGFGEQKWAEFFLINAQYNAFWNQTFAGNPMLQILDSLIIETSYEDNRKLAKAMKTKITQLYPGYPAPEFTLLDKNNQKISLNDFKGKYIYLNFCSYEAYPCLVDFEILNALQNEFKRKMEVISISTDEDFGRFLGEMEMKSCQFTLLNAAGNKDLLEAFRVRTIPTYILIDPYGNILQAPSIAPGENFRNEFFRILNKQD